MTFIGPRPALYNQNDLIDLRTKYGINKLKQILSEGKAVVNGWLKIPSSFSAEVMAHQGWDSLTIDMQHGVIDYPNALQMLQAISTTDVDPMVRVNWNEPGQIMKILDCGISGIICPLINTKKEAQKFFKLKNIYDMVKNYYVYIISYKCTI